MKLDFLKIPLGPASFRVFVFCQLLCHYVSKKLPVLKLSIPVATRDSNSKVMINKVVMKSNIIEK